MFGFDESLTFVLHHEGGVVNHPDDPGGLTNRGITQKTYDAFLAKRGRPQRSVREIRSDEVREIYRTYWTGAGCDNYPGPVSICVFDFAVNAGTGRSVRFLQKSLWLVEDGTVGPMTISAAASADWELTCWTHLTLRREYYRQLVTLNPKKKVFLPGWLNRVDDLRQLVFANEPAA